MTADEDRSDVKTVLAGDVSAFAGIVRRWQGPLVSMAYRFCRDRGRAEEMAQEAFLRAYRGLSRWRDTAAFSTWLFAVAANFYRSELRRIPARAVPLDAIAEPSDPVRHHEHLEDAERELAVRRSLLALPPRYREPLLLHYFQDLDVNDTARALGLPVGTIKARLSRGRAILSRKLSHLSSTPGTGGTR